MTSTAALFVSCLLTLSPYRVVVGAEPEGEEDPWAEYEDKEPPNPATAPAPEPAAAPAPAPAPAAAPPAEERPRMPSSGVGLLATGPVLIAVGIPFSFWGNQVFRNGCIDTSSNMTVGDAIGEGFACGLSATGSFLLHGVAFVLYAAGAGMTGGGGIKKGKHDAWVDAFETRDPRNTTGLKAGGGVMLGVFAAGLIGSRAGLWATLDNCGSSVPCVQTRQRLASSVAAISVFGIAAGAAMLGYGVAYDKRLYRWAPDLAVLPSAGRGYGGLSLVGRF